MSITVLTELSPGAPVLSGQNGALCAVLDWALVQASWAIEYTSGTTQRVYRPGSGNRFRLYVAHDSSVSGSAALATVRGCENAASTASLTYPFPLVSQATNALSVWLCSSTASSAARPYVIILSETFFYLFVDTTSANAWTGGFFGDMPGGLSGDLYNTYIVTRNSSALTANSGMGVNKMLFNNVSSLTLTGGGYWCRDITGVTKSTFGAAEGTGISMANIGIGVAARQGYQNRIYREKVGAMCYGSTSISAGAMNIRKRGWFPNLWNPLHTGAGAVSAADTFTDTAYDPAASFRMFADGLLQASSGCIIETTNTWSPPSG